MMMREGEGRGSSGGREGMRGEEAGVIENGDKGKNEEGWYR